MEAFRFGFAPDTPPAFKFDPTDDDIVAHYLLPRALGIPNPPFAHAVLDANPASFPPPELLARHGHATSHHAFFLDVTTSNGGRRERVINGRDGGTWRGQQGQFFPLTLLSPGGGEVDIEYKRYDLTFKKFDDDDEQEDVKGKNKRKRKDGSGGTPSGWVMHEYTIVKPPLQNTVLSRIHLTKGKIKENQLQAADLDQHHHFIPAPQQLGQSYYQHDFPQYLEQQPGPSYYHDFPYQVVQAGPSHHQDFPYQGQAGPSTGFSDGGQAHDASFYRQEFPYHEQAGPSCYQGFPMPEHPGPSYYHHPADADGRGKAEDASFYGDEIPYQQHAPPSYQGFPMPDQPGPSYYHHHPANVMAGGEGFSDGIQADDASFYADNGDAAGDGFVNLLCAGEGLADHKTAYGDNFCEDGFQSTSGCNVELTHGHCATQETFPSKPDS